MAHFDTDVVGGQAELPPDGPDALFAGSQGVIHVEPPATSPDVLDEPDASDATSPAAGRGVIELQLRHVGIVLGASLVIAMVGFLLLGNITDGDGLSIAYPIALAGGLGGTANTVRRVQLLAREPATTLGEVPHTLAVAQIYLSTIVGGGFALLLYLVFLGGMLQGEFFPAFACGGDGFTTYREFALCNPATNADAALTLVWAFLAGFAERFVPTLLDRFVEHDGDG